MLFTNFVDPRYPHGAHAEVFTSGMAMSAVEAFFSIEYVQTSVEQNMRR